VTMIAHHLYWQDQSIGRDLTLNCLLICVILEIALAKFIEHDGLAA